MIGPRSHSHSQETDSFVVARMLKDWIAERCGLELPIESHGRPLPEETAGLFLELRSDGPADEDPEAYGLEVGRNGARLWARSLDGLRHAAATLIQLLDHRGSAASCRIEDAPDFPRRGIMLDVSRGRVPTESSLRELVDRCARLKLNVLMLYVEHTFRFRRHPHIGTGASPLDAETVRALDDYAADRGVELVPCLQSLGHMEYVLCWPEYRNLAETGMGWTISPADPGTYALLADLYAEFLPNFRSPLFNANCDEPWDLERGRSAARAAELGPGGVYLEHVGRIRDLAGEHGKRTMIWGDVVHAHPGRIDEIDRDLILLDWWYEADHIDFDRVEAFERAGLDFWVCPGTSTWNSLFPRVANSIENISRWADAGRRHGAGGLLVTDWGDFGHYNLPGNSLLAYAWAAQEAWSGASDSAAFDRAFGRALFGDASGAAARAIRALGDVHDPGFSIFNGSALQYLYFDDVERSLFVSAASPAKLDRCERAVERALGRVRKSAEAFGADQATRAEIEYAAEASLHAIRKARAGLAYLGWRRDPTATRAAGRRALARELRSLADEQAALTRRFRRLWLARSEPSNLEATLDRVSRAIRSLRRAAGRLERDRPSPAPPEHRGFERDDVVAALKRSQPRPPTATRPR